jgi:hypothetical protein
MKEAAWNEALRPALSDRKGGALFISTPKGRNWFWRLWARGQQGNGGWHSWRFPTSSNPFIDQGEVDAAQENLPERIFQQEYLAMFIEDAGGVFRNVMPCVTASEQGKALAGHNYTFGVDWGKHADFTVITVVDMTDRAVVSVDRFNQIDYHFQVQRLKVLCDKFKPDIIVAERNAMGDPLIEQLWREELPVRPFVTTNQSKAEVIERLALAFEKGDIAVLNDPALVSELQAFEMKRLPSGMFRYAAPDGMHDDCVISLALAWHGATPRGVYLA